MEQLIYRRLRSAADAGWDAAYRLYKASFPSCERRCEQACAAVLDDDRLHAECVFDGERFAGLIFWWQAGDGWAYLEHLAVDPALRGRSYGARMLRDLRARVGRVVLEIEPPEDDMSRRRQGFYERNGFVCNAYDYIHPSYLLPPQPHRLVVMSYPAALAPAAFEAFRAFAHGVATAYAER